MSNAPVDSLTDLTEHTASRDRTALFELDRCRLESRRRLFCGGLQPQNVGR
jgi:hypothetical protein